MVSFYLCIMKKYRFKTQEEFESTCEKDENGAYICGDDTFEKDMFFLFGKEYKPSLRFARMVWAGNEIWNTTPDMLVEIKD